MKKKIKIFPYESYLKPLARKLRQNMTLGEVLLWQEIRNRKFGYQFHRQVPILKYIVDFYCHELSLAIEIDGKSHDHMEKNKEDLERQIELENLGIRFLRFEEKQIRKRLSEVLDVIENWIEINQ